MNQTAADPNQNSRGQSAAESCLSIGNDLQLRVPYYCEENVWRLAYKMTREHPDDRFYVCFISNESNTVAMYNQLAASDERDKPVIWDYHVILIRWCHRDEQAVVHDVDSRLSYPQSLRKYLLGSFTSSRNMTFGPPFAPLFKLIPAHLYLHYFASDRMHMFNAKIRTWNAPPPPYNCIEGRPNGPSLDRTDSAHAACVTLQNYLNFATVKNAEVPDYDIAGGNYKNEPDGLYCTSTLYLRMREVFPYASRFILNTFM
ncbi:hypothetical protein MPSEU_000439600 [Mayamaea pseudoterrestris]|nr:hypothetical protein MPSEU_000439600 [Mayamaea pseudoterrestris]